MLIESIHTNISPQIIDLTIANQEPQRAVSQTGFDCQKLDVLFQARSRPAWKKSPSSCDPLQPLKQTHMECNYGSLWIVVPNCDSDGTDRTTKRFWIFV
jgi:phosphoribosyl-AMP cyclohydrolase